MGTFILSLGLGAIGAWVGWELGNKVAYRRPRDLFKSPHLRIWSISTAVVMAFLSILFGYVLVDFLGG